MNDDHQNRRQDFLPELHTPADLSLFDPIRSLTNDGIERAEARLLNAPQIDLPLEHYFAPGIYLRQIFMPAGTFVIGHEHKTEHFNLVQTGRALVLLDGEPYDITAPLTFVSRPGVRKVLYILEDMRWSTVHPTHETDPAKLEAELIVKSASYLQHEADLLKLRQLVADRSSP